MEHTAKKFLTTIETNRLLLRKITIDDLDDIYEYASQTVVSRYVPWGVHQSKEDTSEFLRIIEEKNKNNNRLTWGIALKESNKLIGTIDLIKWQPAHAKAELAYVLSNFYWGKGLMVEAAEALLNYGFNKMNLNKISGQILLENQQSERVLQKLGMKFEGTLREELFMKEKYVDLKNFSLLKSEYEQRKNEGKVEDERF